MYNTDPQTMTKAEALASARANIEAAKNCDINILESSMGLYLIDAVEALLVAIEKEADDG